MPTKSTPTYPWAEVRHAIERTEEQKLITELEDLESAREGVSPGSHGPRRIRFGLELLGGIVVGVSVGLGTAMFNFLLFVWILHVEF